MVNMQQRGFLWISSLMGEWKLMFYAKPYKTNAIAIANDY